jgi:hypothetical protein
MAVRQGDKKKVNTGIKIDPDTLEDAKVWASMNNSNFSAMVELLVKTVVDRDRAAIDKFKKIPKNTLGAAVEQLFNSPKTDYPKSEKISRKNKPFKPDVTEGIKIPPKTFNFGKK